MLQVAEGLELPLEAVTETFAILAKKRVGKSNAAVVKAEAMYDAGLPWVALDPKGDWWGVRYDGAGPGLEVVIFGGLHGDVPLPPDSGAYIADLIAEQRLTCVLDVSEMTKGEQQRFVTAFAERLLKVNREPLHVFLEECDEFVPQRVMAEDARMVGAIGKLVRRGGFRGIGVTMISQRAALVNKDVLTQVETLIVLRTTAPLDQKMVKEWLEASAEGGAIGDVMATLARLEDGEAWVVSPQFLGGDARRCRFHRRRTFDSGSTPKIGETRTVPTRAADVDLAQIKEAMQDAIDRAKADDPKELHRQIADLKRQLVLAQGAAPAPERVEVEVAVPFVPPEVDESLGRVEELMRGLADSLGAARSAAQSYRAERVVPPAPAPAVTTAAPRRTTAPARSATTEGQEALPAYPMHLLATLAKRHPVGMGLMAWATAAGRSHTSSAWKDAQRVLQREGLIQMDGPRYHPTERGLEVAGVPADAHTPSPEELVAYWCARLNTAEGNLLTALVGNIAEHGRTLGGLTREEWGEATGYSLTSSGFKDGVRVLIRLGLAVERQGYYVPSDDFR